jgi:hypothetical protein
VAVGKQGLKNHLCVALHVFIHCPRNGKNFQTFWLRDVATGVGLVGILITGNADGVRKSRKLVCHHGMLSRPRGKILVKFGTSLDDRSLETRASHKKDHSFQKETWQFELQLLATSSFRLEFFP